MSRYTDLLDQARGMKPAEVNARLRRLAAQPDFASVVAWIEANHAAWTRDVAKQSFADSHGKLAHAAGSLHGLDVLRGQLQNLIDKPVRQREQPPEE